MDLVILTPLEIEYQSVYKHLSQVDSKVINNQRYDYGFYQGKHHLYKIAIRQAGSTNTSVALAAENAIRHFQPSIVILAGIAGGIKKVDVGDIVIGTKAYGYDSGKETKDGFIVRPDVVSFDTELVEFARSFTKNGNWQKQLSNEVKVVFGPIASGDRVIASTESGIYHLIQRNYNDTLAIDMESIGFAKALSGYPHLRSMSIRCISDLLDNKARADWAEGQAMSVHNLASFLFEFIFHLDFEKIKPVLMGSKELAQKVVNLIFPLLKIDSKSTVSFEPITLHETAYSEIWEKVKSIFSEEIKAEDSLKDAMITTRSNLRREINKDRYLQKSLTELIKQAEKEGKTEKEIIKIQDSKNVIQGSDIKVGGNFHLGDKTNKNVYSDQDVQIGDRIIFQVLQGNDPDDSIKINELSIKIDAYESDRLQELGRLKIQDFGKAASSNWNEHAWHLLGQALTYFSESIGKNPKNQHSWTNLAYTYYLIGEKEKALKCLVESKRLASPGPNYPGGFYKSVETAIQRNIALHGWKITRPRRPPWFDEKHLI